MTAVALIDDYRQEFDHQELLFDGGAFRAITALADAGALTPTSLDLADANLTYAQYEKMGEFLGRMNRSCSWWVGDWLLYGEGAFSEKFAQAASATGLAEQTLVNRMYVCKHVPASRRRASLPFSVHAEVASLPAREQKLWLDRAERGGWTRAILREHMKAKRKDEKPPLDAGENDEPGVLVQVALAILRDARQHEDGQHHLVPNEDIARLRAALDREEE